MRTHKRTFTACLAGSAAVFLVACNPYVDLKRGIASAGFMNKSQAFAGKMKTPMGSASWSTVDSDATDVPIAGLQALGSGWVTHNLTLTRVSDNAKDVANTKTAADVTKNASDNATKITTGGQVPLVTDPGKVVTFPPTK